MRIGDQVPDLRRILSVDELSSIRKSQKLGHDNSVYQAPDFAAATTSLATPRSPSEYAQRSRSDNTKRCYGSDLRGFSHWCQKRGLSSFPAAPSTVALFVAERANDGRKVSTIRRCLSAISMTHKRAGAPNPAETGEVQGVMEGISRTKGIAPTQKRPLTIEILRHLLQCVPDDLRGARDKTLLLIQFSGALRRSELVDLRVLDLEFMPDGLKLRVRKSKTDQEGRGDFIGIVRGDHADTCPIRALKAWLGMADVQNGPIFRPITRHGYIGTRAMTGGSVARVIKGYVEEAGLNPTVYSGHSARAGFITTAALAGASERQISRVSRHRSMESLRGYVRTATVFQDTAAAMVGL